MDYEYIINNRSGALWCGGIVMDSMHRDDCTLRSETRSTRQKTKKGRQMEKRIYKRTNPFSGESELLTNTEAMLHDEVKQAEAMEQYEKMQKALTKFSKLNPKAYMTLLD